MLVSKNFDFLLIINFFSPILLKKNFLFSLVSNVIPENGQLKKFILLLISFEKRLFLNFQMNSHYPYKSK